MELELGTFTATLRRLDAAEIRAIAADLRSDARTAEHEIAAMRAMLGIDDHLRGLASRNRAAHAARSAGELVQAAARAAGFELPDDDVTCVARAAAVLARGIVAGPSASTEVLFLAQPWARVLHGALAAA